MAECRPSKRFSGSIGPACNMIEGRKVKEARARELKLSQGRMRTVNLLNRDLRNRKEQQP